MPGPKDLDPSSSPRALLGAELRHARERQGLSQAELGEPLFVSGSFIGQLEAGTRRMHVELAAQLDEVLGTSGFFTRNCTALAKSRYPDHFAEAAEAEAVATAIREYAQLLIPGLLQTRAYAEAVFRAYKPTAPDPEITDLVTARLARACVLDDPTTPLLWAILDEAVLRRPVGGGAVMSEALATCRTGPRPSGHRAGTAVRRRSARRADRPSQAHGLRGRALTVLRRRSGHGKAAGRSGDGQAPHADVQPPSSLGTFAS